MAKKKMPETMILKGPAVITRTVMCVKCQHAYDVGFNAGNRALNPACQRVTEPGKTCGCVKWSFSPKAEVERMVEANISAVWWVVISKIMRQFPEAVIDKLGGSEELVGEGMLSLVDAAHHFDPQRVCERTGKPVTFNTYAVKTIEQRVRSFIDYELRHGANGEPIIGDLCPRCGANVEKSSSKEFWCPDCEQTYDHAERGRYVVACKETSSIQGMMENGVEGGKHDGDFFVPDKNAKSPGDEAHDNQVRDDLMQKMRRLDPRRQKVIEFIYFQGMTLNEAARILGVTKERIRQNKLEALGQLAEWYGAEAPAQFVRMEINRGKMVRCKVANRGRNTCRHCHEKPAGRPRGSCAGCYRNLEVRARYAPGRAGRHSACEDRKTSRGDLTYLVSGVRYRYTTTFTFCEDAMKSQVQFANEFISRKVKAACLLNAVHELGQCPPEMGFATKQVWEALVFLELVYPLPMDKWAVSAGGDALRQVLNSGEE